MLIPTSAPEYDAFVTYFEDRGGGLTRPFAVDFFLGSGAMPGTVISLDDEDAAPPAELGANLALVVDGLPEIDRVLFVVCGVPVPAWAIALFGEFQRHQPSTLRWSDVLGVNGYRWDSYLLSRKAA